MDPLQVHKNGKIFLLLDTEIGAVGRIASMAILPAGALSVGPQINVRGNANGVANVTKIEYKAVGLFTTK